MKMSIVMSAFFPQDYQKPVDEKSLGRTVRCQMACALVRSAVVVDI
jgi:hypothetical protein